LLLCFWPQTEHKIQSSSNPLGLTVHLYNVPKVLNLITNVWAPSTFVISFKVRYSATPSSSSLSSSIAHNGPTSWKPMQRSLHRRRRRR
jgi:hypothetical protein